jgi:hypothetical protein
MAWTYFNPSKESENVKNRTFKSVELSEEEAKLLSVSKSKICDYLEKELASLSDSAWNRQEEYKIYINMLDCLKRGDLSSFQDRFSESLKRIKTGFENQGAINFNMRDIYKRLIVEIARGGDPLSKPNAAMEDLVKFYELKAGEILKKPFVELTDDQKLKALKMKKELCIHLKDEVSKKLNWISSGLKGSLEGFMKILTCATDSDVSNFSEAYNQVVLDVIKGLDNNKAEIKEGNFGRYDFYKSIADKIKQIEEASELKSRHYSSLLEFIVRKESAENELRRKKEEKKDGPKIK